MGDAMASSVGWVESSDDAFVMRKKRWMRTKEGREKKKSGRKKKAKEKRKKKISGKSGNIWSGVGKKKVEACWFPLNCQLLLIGSLLPLSIQSIPFSMTQFILVPPSFCKVSPTRALISSCVAFP
jgi:hypothetical protein